MLGAIATSLAVSLAVFAVVMIVISRMAGSRKETQHTQHALHNLMEESRAIQQSAKVEEDPLESKILPLLRDLPGGRALAALIVESGLGQKADVVLMGMAVAIVVALSLAKAVGAGFLGVLVAVALACYFSIKRLKSRIIKRRVKFIDLFPDAIDMVARSVRSGFPIHAAFQLAAESASPPVSDEFRRVTEEVALGNSLEAALVHMAERVAEPDVKFFVVVLNVQQETGGNLAEVLTNLASVIRKRRQLRLRIRALTSEGRATGWVLGALPVVMFGIIWAMTPQHFDPLFSTEAGHTLLYISAGMMAFAFWVVQQMLDIDI